MFARLLKVVKSGGIIFTHLFLIFFFKAELYLHTAEG